jgi:aspartyl-tRNA(Asn)/glutamyl-tRNA(Gln) amidotransferase subunit C
LRTYYNVELGGIGGKFAPLQGLHRGGDGKGGVRQGQPDGLFPQIQPQKPLAGRNFQLFQRYDGQQRSPFACLRTPRLLAHLSHTYHSRNLMSVDKDTVRRIAKLARLAVPENRLEPMAGELNGIFQWVEMLGEVNVEGVPAMTSVVAQKLRWRKDEVSDGGQADALMINAPEGEEHFFVVPKVIE